MDSEPRTQAPWSLLTKIAFRFCVVYFGAFCVVFAQILFEFVGVVALWLPRGAVIAQMSALEPAVRWFGRTVLGVDVRPSVESGSGDQAVIWLLIVTLLLAAVVATAVWSVLDRRRTAYPRLAAWFTVFLRLCLGGQMLFYGFAKLIPTQMPAPGPKALLTPFGDFAPMAVLWMQVGSSFPYEIALGTVEVLAGILLFIPRTATLGTLVALVATAQVFLLNMTFDVPVKILSLHLLLISLVLLAPKIRRLVDVVVLGRGADPEPTVRLFDSARRDRLARAAQIVLCVWVVVSGVVLGFINWREFGHGAAKPPHYGIWAVGEFTVDGTARQPLTTDTTRWQRLVFDQPGAVTVQRMDGTFVDARAEVEPNRLVLPDAGATFAITRPTPDTMRLDGTDHGKRITMTLTQQDLDDFTLRSRGFHWVQEQPFFG